MADLHHLRVRRGQAGRHLVAGAVRSGGVGAEDGGDLFRGYAPEAGSGDDAGRPGHRSSSWTSRRRDWIHAAVARCGRSSASWWPTVSPSSSPPSTSTKPISSPTGSRYSTRATWSPRALPTSSSARSPAVTSGSGSPTSSELDAAARVLTGSTRDDEDLTLRVPSDGRAKSLRALLDQLDEHSIDVEEFSVHTPDLDDVFLALTGHASTEVIAQ